MDEKFEILDCSKLSAEELVRILTLDKGIYTEGTLQLATRELSERKLDLAEFVNRVQIGLNDAEPESCTIDQTLAKIKQEISWGQGWAVANCLQEGIIILKEAAFWTIHFFVNGECLQSFTFKTRETLEVFVEQFLRLVGGRYIVDHQYHLDECEIFADSYSSGYIEKTSRALAQADIPHTVRVSEPPSSRQILVPQEYVEIARAVAAEVAAKIQSLRDEISALAAKDEHDSKLLELYDQLAQRVDGDAAVSYGRGVLLFERGRNEEAAEAFIELAQTCMGSQRDLPAADFEAYWEASESHLERLSASMPKNLDILHCLANMAGREKNDAKIKERYEKILAVSPSDSIAHLNLANLYFEDPYYHAQAAKHFRSYLESQPDDENRAAIEEALANLEH